MAKKEHTNNTRKKIIDVDTWDEAEKIVLQKIQEGENFRDIAKIKFRINGKIRGIYISQISAIKKEFEDGGVAVDAKGKTILDKNLQIIAIFKLLKKKMSIADIVIKTGFSLEVINEAVKAYQEFERYRPVKREVMKFLLAELSSVFPCKNDEDLMEAAAKAAHAHYLLRSHPYICDYCGELEIPGKNELKWLQKQLSHSKWGHLECLKKNGDPIEQFL